MIYILLIIIIFQGIIITEIFKETKKIKKDIGVEKFTEILPQIKQLKKDKKIAAANYDKGLLEANLSVDIRKNKLKKLSKDIGKIVEFIKKQNPDEEIEELVQEFDSLYVINAALVKWERIYSLKNETAEKYEELKKENTKNMQNKNRVISANIQRIEELEEEIKSLQVNAENLTIVRKQLKKCKKFKTNKKILGKTVNTVEKK